jgi:hypothetical protein
VNITAVIFSIIYIQQKSIEKFKRSETRGNKNKILINKAIRINMTYILGDKN